jgi:hypothetical protein
VTRLATAKPLKSRVAVGRVHLVKDQLSAETPVLKKLPKSFIRHPSTAIILARKVEGTVCASRFVGKIVRTFSDARYLYILQEPLPETSCAPLSTRLGVW